MSPSTEASAWVQSAKQGHEAAHVVNVVYFVFRDKIFFISLFIFFSCFIRCPSFVLCDFVSFTAKLPRGQSVTWRERLPQGCGTRLAVLVCLMPRELPPRTASFRAFPWATPRFPVSPRSSVGAGFVGVLWTEVAAVGTDFFFLVFGHP